MNSAIARHVGLPSSALLSSLGSIEVACFDRPWGPDGLAEVLQAGATVVYLMDAPAYCLYQRVLDEVEILQLCTHPAAQRQGLGRRLVAAVLDEAEAADCVAVFLEVRSSNRAAIALYEGAGFAACGLRRGYYPAQVGAESSAAEDALLLRCDLPRQRKSR